MAEQVTIGDNLRRLREAAGLTQNQLSNEAGVTVGNVSQIEQGVVNDPKISTLLKLAAVLDCSVLDLIEGIAVPAKPAKSGKRSPKADEE